jgi:hypothetical protein
MKAITILNIIVIFNMEINKVHLITIKIKTINTIKITNTIIKMVTTDQLIGRNYNVTNNLNIKKKNLSNNKVIVSKWINSKQISKNKEILSNNKELK